MLHASTQPSQVFLKPLGSKICCFEWDSALACCSHVFWLSRSLGENQSLGKATWKNKWCWYPFPVPAPQALGVGHRWCDAQVSIQPWVRAPGRRIWVLSCQRWNSTEYVGWELPTLQVLQRATCFSCRPKRSEKCFWCNSTVDITRWFSDGFLYHSPCWGEESVSSSKWVFMRIRFDDGISSHDKTSLPKLQKMKTKPSQPYFDALQIPPNKVLCVCLGFGFLRFRSDVEGPKPLLFSKAMRQHHEVQTSSASTTSEVQTHVAEWHRTTLSLWRGIPFLIHPWDRAGTHLIDDGYFTQPELQIL